MSEANQAEQPSPKRLKTASPDDDEGQATKTTTTSSPVTIVTWNANGLVSRCKYNEPELKQLLRETDPDVLCVQEARLKAMSPALRGTPVAADCASVEKVLESTVFGEYQKFWSLADKRYAGTLTLIHKRLSIQDDSFVAFSTRAALSLLLKKYNVKRSDVAGLPTSTATTTSDSNSQETSSTTATSKKQTSISAFFTPKACPAKAKSSKHVPPDHHPEGRFQFFCFPHCDLMQTYNPNNGKDEKGFQRRRDWDRDMKEFLQHRQLVLNKANQADRPLLWCGDMNVAKDYRDGTHWEERTTQNSDGETVSTIYEWWRDETQCFSKGQAKDLDPNRSPDDCGIASFTTNERRRFAEILQQGDLSDVWRELHADENEETVDDAKYKTKWDRPCYTWRGHLGKAGNPYASKYQGKGQRIDYFLLSPSRLTSQMVDKCEILGYGEMREGLFCGSDHCPSILKLKRPLGAY